MFVRDLWPAILISMFIPGLIIIIAPADIVDKIMISGGLVYALAVGYSLGLHRRRAQ